LHKSHWVPAFAGTTMVLLSAYGRVIRGWTEET
jgi:hypothetical protein